MVKPKGLTKQQFKPNWWVQFNLLDNLFG